MKKVSVDNLGLVLALCVLGLVCSALVEPISETLHIAIFSLSLLSLAMVGIFIPGVNAIKALFRIKSTVVAVALFAVFLALLLFGPGIIDAIL